MIGVIDASTLIRIFVPDDPFPESADSFFRGVERGENIAIAPELLIVESANVVSKKRKQGDLSDEEGEQLLSDLLSMPIRYYPHLPIISNAYDLSKRYDLTVYDAIYIALSIDQSAVLFTEDQKLREVAIKLHLIA